ncbi:MAG: AMP-binding protein [Mycobacterium sp.]|uniref:AMP-binding protein n=1 Tax=Mycobacterium sp. TaxID=1785 RepID=UPI001EB41D37|nr:AMP-binding protein [Mycobacterium sp.]MBV8787545.1 AMP-binding protein [Mycobacterium sp.]
MADNSSLRENLLQTVRRHPERPALTYRVNRGSSRPAGNWHTITWHEFGLLVVEVANEIEELCEPGCTVAVLAGNDARYPILEQAVIATGRKLQPLYTSTPNDELMRAMSVTGANVVVVGDDQEARALECPLADEMMRAAVRVIGLSALVRLPCTPDRAGGLLRADTEPFDTDQVRAHLSRWPERLETDAVLYLQSTGTTGPAHVIEISEKAILAAMQALPDELLNAHPTVLSFLPTGHISERLLVGYLSVGLAAHTWFGGGIETLGADLSHCKPSVFLVPPLVLEAIRSEATAAASASRLGRWLLKSAAADAARNATQTLTGPMNRGLQSRLFGWRLRRKCGLNRADVAISGTAPLSADVHAWWETLGLPLRNVYGQTEVSGATSMTRPVGSVRGGVGCPLSWVEVKVADNGELLVRSPSMFTRYVGDERRTVDAFESGWFKTGDRARLTGNGELVLLGRIQSIIPTPGGGVADLNDLTRRVTSALGAADVAYFRDRAGVHVYVAVHPDGVPRHSLMDQGILDPIPISDPLTDILQSQLRSFPGRDAIAGFGLFRGAFGFRDGEVGPTGKARGWRIHQLHGAQHVRLERFDRS